MCSAPRSAHSVRIVYFVMLGIVKPTAALPVSSHGRCAGCVPSTRSGERDDWLVLEGRHQVTVDFDDDVDDGPLATAPLKAIDHCGVHGGDRAGNGQVVVPDR